MGDDLGDGHGGGPPHEEGGDYEDGEFPFLKADHPLLARVQRALTEQLGGQNERISLQLSEKLEELRKLNKHREDIGVTLYGAQQQLAKLQLQLEQLHDRYAVTSNARLESEEGLREVTARYEERKVEVDEALRRLNKSQDELNQLDITLRQVEEYNEQMKAEIQVTRRATYKAEDHIKGIEKVKGKQDLLIDKMNDNVRRMTEQKALLDAQMVAQRQETEAAVATLKEATREMEAIEFEKQQLMQQWRSSLIGMQRRDEALQNVKKALDEQAEAELGVENEIRGLQNSVKAEQEKHEQLSSQRDRNDHEMQYLQTQMANIKADRERLMEQYNMLKRSLDHTTSETQKLDTSIADSQQQLEVVEKSVQKVSRETTGLYTEIEEQVSEQTTVERSQANSTKSSRRVREDTQQKEIETQNLHNEIARVKVDSLNTRAHNQMLQDRLKDLSGDLQEREKLIEQYELEIRKRHHQIEKKQLYVDRLNRDYDEKRSKLEGESGEADIAGPLEAKIKHLRKSIAEKSKECQDMQKDWIGKQTQLMDAHSDTDRLRSFLNDQKNRRLVLDQKRIRIEGHLESQHKEIRELENSVKHLRFDMDRMNGALATNGKKIDALANSNQMLETEFVAKLKEIERASLEMELGVKRVREEKEEMSVEIVEAERQVMLWERKIHLEREMQEALDPSVGQVESTAMKKEIHRMELRLDQLKRRQEQMIMEMERAIYKRDAIQMKNEPKAKKSKAANTTANLKRQVASLKNNLKLCNQANAEAEQKIAGKEEEIARVQQGIKQTLDETQQLETMADELRATVEVNAVVRQSNLAGILRLQRTARRFEEISAGGAQATMSPPQLQAAVQEQQATKLKLIDVVKTLHDAYPQMEMLWVAFYEWLGVDMGR